MVTGLFTRRFGAEKCLFRGPKLGQKQVFWPRIIYWKTVTQQSRFHGHAVNRGGAGSEVWNRVYRIAPVKKFDRVRLSTIFHGRTMSVCSVISFAGSKHQEYTFSIIFLMESLDMRRRDV